MKRKKLQHLLYVIEGKIEKAKTRHDQNKTSAQEIAVSVAASPSQSGDRAHAEGQVEISKKKLHTLNLLKTEVETGIKTKVPDRIKAPCYTEFGDYKLFFVENPVYVDGTVFVTKSSPLGKTIKNKKVGDEVEINGMKLTIKIIE